MSSCLTPQNTTDSKSLDRYFTIDCGVCGKSAPIDDWMRRPVSGELPRGHYQCPSCNYAFHRKAGQDRWGCPGIVCEPVAAVL